MILGRTCCVFLSLTTYILFPGFFLQSLFFSLLASDNSRCTQCCPSFRKQRKDLRLENSVKSVRPYLVLPAGIGAVCDILPIFLCMELACRWHSRGKRRWYRASVLHRRRSARDEGRNETLNRRVRSICALWLPPSVFTQTYIKMLGGASGSAVLGHGFRGSEAPAPI